MLGKRIWVFADGDLPPRGNEEPFGHESMMVVNDSDSYAHIEVELLFETREPVSGLHLTVDPRRVKCFRMDDPFGEEKFSIPMGQYAVILKSDVPVVAVYGRLDRRKDMAYYSVAGYGV